MNDDNLIILVDFDEPGMAEVSLVGDLSETAVEKSKAAIANALRVVTWVGEKAKAALDAAHDRPDEAELEFGIKVGSRAGVLVSQADSEFHIKARLVWKKPAAQESKENEPTTRARRR
jgi:hypothetical protein